jgi:hypothetical protein
VGGWVLGVAVGGWVLGVAVGGWVLVLWAVGERYTLEGVQVKEVALSSVYSYRVNGKIVGHASNYHRRYKFDVTVSSRR